MRWSKTASRSVRAPELPGPRVVLWGSFGMAVLLSALLIVALPTGDKRVSIYSSAANYTLPVLERNGQDYVGLFEVLEPLGTVRVDGQASRWKLRYNDVDSEFAAGKRRCRIRGRDYDLPANFLLEDGRGLVPLASLSTLMPRFLGGPVTFHETSRRLFIGNVAVHFTAQVNKNTPPMLVMDFTAPVNPRIATEPGKLLMVFSHEPLVPPGSQLLTFDSKTIPSASYQEDNGAAEISVTGTVPLFASFSNDGRTITIAAAPSPATQAVNQPPTQPPAGTPLVTAPGTVATAGASGNVPYFVVVDATHGGDERGAALNDQVAEKDVTLAFARRLRQELQGRGLTTLVIRDGDITLSPDQRASMVNSLHPRIYIGVHIASQGHGVRLYSALLPAGGENHGPFLDWQTAQSSFLVTSQAAVLGMEAELQKRHVPVRALIAPLRPLNNITTTAIAVEIAPPAGGLSELNDADYQQGAASALAAGVLALRDKLEARR
jgi:N-acetylmuramoyl-L-alanine amidase